MLKTAAAFALVSTALVATAQKPHRVVIEVTSGGQFGLAGLLESVDNLRKAFAPETVAVEVVCRGESLDLLLKSHNVLASRVKKEMKFGVVFAACGNTMRGRGIPRDRLLPDVIIVPAGIAEAVVKQEQGWSYLRE
jgi:hypothetical protein